MDGLIFEEFKGTGNSGIHLDRKFADRACPSDRFSEERDGDEELLLPKHGLNRVWVLRKVLNPPSKMGKTSNNGEFCRRWRRASNHDAVQQGPHSCGPAALLVLSSEDQSAVTQMTVTRM
jgi:transcription termination factor Rho